MSLYLALIHHPVVDRHGDIITSSVTNLDLHDIARSAQTFGVKKYFVVHPSPDEQALNQRIISHWLSQYASTVHPTRQEAVRLIELCSEFEQCLEFIEKNEGQKPLVVGTSARLKGNLTFTEEKVKAIIDSRPVLIIFGTGYGLASSWDSRIEAYFPPIVGPGTYNHLSVRSAVAIYLARLMGR